MNVENLTVKFMSALRDAPKGPNQWAEKSAQEICEGLKFSNAEFKSVIDYAFHKKLIERTGKNDGHYRVRLGANEENWFSSHSTQFHQTWHGQLIFAVLAGMTVAFLAWKFGWLS